MSEVRTGPAILSCGTHAEAVACMVCDHLFQQHRTEGAPPLAYYFADENDDSDDDEDHVEETCVWCADCDAMLQAHGEWNDVTEAFAAPHLVCEFCLADILATNVPAPPDPPNA